MICPNCNKDSLSNESVFAYSDFELPCEGTVSFYECLSCGARIEIWIPDGFKEEGDES